MGIFFDMNRCAVFAMRLLGKGLAALRRFCYMVNMPPPVAVGSYRAHHEAIAEAACQLAHESMDKAAEDARQARREQGAEHEGRI